MGLVHRTMHELTRRRGHRGRRSGVALLVVVAIMMVLTVLVTELAYTSRVRMLVATHQQQRAQAYWLARTGVAVYQLVLAADKQIQKQMGNLPLPISIRKAMGTKNFTCSMSTLMYHWNIRADCRLQVFENISLLIL